MSESAAEPLLCPWCSAPVTSGDERCPRCGVALPAPEATPIPGLTVVDPALRATEARLEASRPRRTGWLAVVLGDGRKRERPVMAAPTAAPLPDAPASALQPPSPAVRREMLRLEAELAASRAAYPDDALGEDEAAEPVPAEPDGADATGDAGPAAADEPVADDAAEAPEPATAADDAASAEAAAPAPPEDAV